MSGLTVVAMVILSSLITSVASGNQDYGEDAQMTDRSSLRITLLHMYDNTSAYHELGAVTLSNKKRYAMLHGYDVIWHTPQSTHGLLKCSVQCEEEKHSTDQCDDYNKGTVSANDDFFLDLRPAAFGKIKLIQAACRCRRGQWLFWSDADSLIVNQSVPLSRIINEDYDLIFTMDWLMLNAGVFLIKCSDWSESFLRAVYEDRRFDDARALDQAAIQYHLESVPNVNDHVMFVAKHLMNAYVEEYRPGDFLVHLAGKLYEATTTGATAIANQFDILSLLDDVKDIEAFFNSIFLLNRYSGLCVIGEEDPFETCPVIDRRRITLLEPLGSMSFPYRYRHVGLRYYWLQGWTDSFDISSSHRREAIRPHDLYRDEL